MQKITVIYENENLLVLDKPSGLAVHKDGKRDEYTLADWVLENYQELAKVGEPWRAQNGEVILRPGIAHRLDKETSGVLLVAKTQEYFEYLKSLFKERQIRKEYRAFVYGGFKEEKKQGVIDLPIARSVKFGKFTAQGKSRGTKREALTHYEVLLQSGEKQEDDFAYLSLRPKTGRTHQLRVHLKAVHRPIVCDKLYAPKKPCTLGFERLALHAYKISFEDLDGKELTFTADLPDDFKKAKELLEKQS